MSKPSHKKSKPFPQHRGRKRPKGRRQEWLPIAGRRAVTELLRRGIKPQRLLISSQFKLQREEPLLLKCREAGWPIEVRDKHELDELSQDLPHQNFLALIREFPYFELEELLSLAAQKPDPIVVALDQIQDVGNLGAILRSAEGAGLAGALIPFDRSAEVTAAAIRRSAGAALHLPICRVVNLAKALERLIEAGFCTIGADLEGTKSLYDIDLKGRIALVMGSEGRGLRPGVKKRCQINAYIPMMGRISSLNVAAAAAVCFFEALRQRSDADRKA